MLELSEIDKRFPGVHALKHVSLQARSGEVLGLVGENGAGKSTLMSVAAGSLLADSGTVSIGGQTLQPATASRAIELGLAIVYQEPALLPDLRVDENIYLAGLQSHLKDKKERAAQALSIWRTDAPLDASLPVRELSPDRRFIVEIAKAVAQQPKVLILDEPTEHLDRESVAALFDTVRHLTAQGCAVIYISHRIREVKQIADRVAVLRDGAVQGTFDADSLSESDVVNLIVGRPLDTVFPSKSSISDSSPVVLRCEGLSSGRLSGLDISLRQGEIVGLAGIDDHGQRDVLRAIAGLQAAKGAVMLGDRSVTRNSPRAAASAGIAYIPNDRHAEGVFADLSVRENLTARMLSSLSHLGVVRGGAEARESQKVISDLRVRTPTDQTRISSLSGGNQQKVVLGRALSGDPRLILADEPTQGVDIGARSEIYEIIKDAADRGAAALVVSSDASELAGLCTRVLVLSRGQLVAELSGSDVTEERITGAVLTSTTSRSHESAAVQSPLRRFVRGDHAPSIVLTLAILILGIYAASRNSYYLTTQNFTGLLGLFAALGFVALAQQVVMLVGGIDLSVGPLAGLLVVSGSFLLSEGKSAGALAIGVVLLAAIAVAVGCLNWALVTVVRITPMIATLVTYTLFQGISLLLRPNPGGVISTRFTTALGRGIGFVPAAAIVVVLVAVVLEFRLYHSRWGLQLRSVGSRPSAAARVGIRNNKTVLGAYVLCSLGAFVAGLLVMIQVGSGDPGAGTSYTLPGIAAVVLGGATITGGRGSFVGALLGALLIQQLNVVTVFLHLSVAWQNYLLGALTLIATGFYSVVRSSRASH